MKTLSTTLKVLTCAIFVFALSTLAHAQTRTWVSGVGDDLNPCSRTAPCKTFAGAISKTSDGGEIDALDPGGYGSVTVTKGITLDGTGTFASILAAGTTGVIINVGDTKVVTIRGLSINGGTPAQLGVNGVRIVTAKHVNIEDTVIFNFTSTAANSGRGVSDVRTSSSSVLVMRNVVSRNNAKNGIAVLGPIKATLDNVEVTGTGDAATGGIAADLAAKVMINRSVSSGNAGVGFFAGGVGTEMNLESSVASGNSIGVQASGSATARLSAMHITGNTTGISFAGATMNTYQTNRIAGNGGGNGPFAGGSQINPQ